MKRILYAAVSAVLCLLLILAEIPVFGAEDSFYGTAELLEIKSHIEKDAGMSTYATVQGACTDGRYAYFAVQEGSTVILKYDLKTWKLKKKATVSGLGHANDMCYNSKEDRLVVANNYTIDDELTLVDPDTLTVTGTVTPKRKKTAKEIKEEQKQKAATAATESSGDDGKDDKDKDYKPIKVYSIAYQASQDRYVVGLSGTYNFALLDKDFKQVKAFKGVMTGYTRQGCDCDEDYIYFSQSGGDNIVVVYDYSGSHVDTVTLDHTHEVENLFHVGKDYYLTLHYYGNSVHRVGLSKEKQIRFSVTYDPAGGSGEMEASSIHYGEPTKLRKCSFTKPGYFFGGWMLRRDFNETELGYTLGAAKNAWIQPKDLYDPELYHDEAKVAKLTKIGSVTMTAHWINERYSVQFDSGTGEGWMAPDTVDYAADYTLPQNLFTRKGYVFSGYTAQRDCDGRIYGCYKGSDMPRWLEPKDVDEPYLFDADDQVSKLTYDGTVTFTAQFSLAFIFDASYTTLLSYVGVDDKVDIPNPDGVLQIIASGAFKDVAGMTELTVPATVREMRTRAVSGCTALDKITFEDSFPASFDRDGVIGSGQPLYYLELDGQPLLLGCGSDRTAAQLIINRAQAILKNR